MVSKVADGGPASKEHGLRVQDIILKVGLGKLSSARLLSKRTFPRARVLKCSKIAFTGCTTSHCVDFWLFGRDINY